MKNIYVYLNISNKDYFVGTLNIGLENSTFEYDKKWLECDIAYQISSDLPLKEGIFETPNKEFFRVFLRECCTYPVEFIYEYLLLYLKKQGLLSEDENFDEDELYDWCKNATNRSSKFMDETKTCKKILSLDKCILYLNDVLRNGSFRFKLDKNGEFLHNFNNIEIPPISKVPELVEILHKINSKKETPEELELFCACSLGLGGRQPKVSVKDNDALYIAKLSAITEQSKDELLKEILALRLAKKFGINTQEYNIQNVNGKDYLLIKRFDRIGDKRIPFIGLGTFVNDVRFENDKLISEAVIKICGENATKNLKEIFKHKLFRCAITNTNAFVPNVGFIFDEQDGWNLAPMYDTTVGFENDSSYNDVLAKNDYETNLTLNDYEDLIKNAQLYGLTLANVKEMVAELKKVLSNWQEEAIKIGFLKEDLYKIRIYLKAFDKIKYSDNK